MSDLIERLRARAYEFYDNGEGGVDELCVEAIGEIERLRRELAEARDVRCPCGLPYVKVSGGFVPSCACSANNIVAVATEGER